MQVDCGILKRFPFKLARSQVGVLLYINFKPSSVKVKDRFAEVEQGANPRKPYPLSFHLHLLPPGVDLFQSFFIQFATSFLSSVRWQDILFCNFGFCLAFANCKCVWLSGCLHFINSSLAFVKFKGFIVYFLTKYFFKY